MKGIDLAYQGLLDRLSFEKPEYVVGNYTIGHDIFGKKVWFVNDKKERRIDIQADSDTNRISIELVIREDDEPSFRKLAKSENTLVKAMNGMLKDSEMYSHFGVTYRKIELVCSTPYDVMANFIREMMG